MARFYTPSSDVSAKPWRVHQGPGVVKVGIVASLNPTAMPASVLAIGLTDMDIEINSNTESSPVRSAQLFQPYDIVVTGQAFQVNVKLDQMDPYQLALALTYNTVDTVTGSSLLTLSTQYPSKYRACRVLIGGPANDGTETTRYDIKMNFDFWKTQWISSGGLTIAPATKSTLPVTIHALANSNDVSGAVWTSNTITSPVYD